MKNNNLAIGVGIGTALGVAYNNVAVGTALGAAFGLLLNFVRRGTFRCF